MQTKSFSHSKTLFYRTAVAVLAVMLIVAAMPAPTAQARPLAAVTITVNTTADDVALNGNCSLREAIAAANGNAASDACPAGSAVETDTIVLASGQTYMLTIGGDLNIVTGAGDLTIQADGAAQATIQAANTNRVFDVANGAGLLTLNRIKVTGGSNVGSGAGIRLGINPADTASLTLLNSTVSGNTATADSCGAGIYKGGFGTVNIYESTIANNICTENTTGGEGAGLWMRDGAVDIRNSTFQGNTTAGTLGKGGGIFSSGGSLNIAFSTFSGNSATGANGGAVHRTSTNTALTVTGSILADSVNGVDCFSPAAIGESIVNTLIETNAAGTDACGAAPQVITGEPGLSPLADNGGPTQTMAITALSPAYNTATSCPSNNLDQRGTLRPQNTTCDLGAFELGPVGPNTAPTVQSPIANVNVLEDALDTTINLHNAFQDAESPDAQLTYTVTGNTNAALFTSANITGNQNLVLDYAPNVNGTSNITVRATDPGALFVEDTFTVTVTAVNDAPVFIPGGPVTVSENSGAQTVTGWATGIDDGDPEVTQTLTFNVTNNNNALFSVQPALNATTGNLTFTPAANTIGTATVNVTLNDNGGTANGGVNSFGPQQFTLEVTNVNQTPTNITLSNSTISENQPVGTVVGTLFTTDQDAGDTFTYSFCGGADDASFQFSGNSLQSAVVFDYETKNSYSICIRTTDLGGLSFTKNFTINVTDVTNDTATFQDVPTNYWAWQYIEAIYRAGITGGCGAGPIYCPTDSVTRDQMAVFLLRGIHGGSYTPPPASGTVFADVPANYWAAAWIEQLAVEGITGGCGGGNYCPTAPVTRDQMAVFLLRAKHGSSYTPPAVGAGTGFTDVPADYWAAAWIKQLAAEGITGGCGVGTYCPLTAVTRDQMAVFLQRTFSLPLQ